MRIILLAMLLVTAIAVPSIGPAHASPGMPKEVEVVMDSDHASVTPLEGKPLIFYQHGVVKWNTTSVSASILDVQVELLIIGLGLSSSIAPLPIILTRSDNEFDFELAIIIPASFPAQNMEYTIQGYYYHTAYPADQRTIDTVPMMLSIEPYSLVAFRELSDNGNEEVGKRRWTTIDVTLWNQGNADDIYSITIEPIGPAKVRYDRTPIPIPRDEFKNYQFEVYAENTEPAIVVVHVGTEHPIVNGTGEMRFTLYVDESSDLLNTNFNLIIGSIASILIIMLIVVAIIYIKRRSGSRRPPRGHG